MEEANRAIIYNPSKIDETIMVETEVAYETAGRSSERKGSLSE